MGSASVNPASSGSRCKMVLVTIERIGQCAPTLHGMFGGTTVSIHFKVMVHTLVGMFLDVLVSIHYKLFGHNMVFVGSLLGS